MKISNLRKDMIMPLKKGTSKKTFGENVKREMEAGRSNNLKV